MNRNYRGDLLFRLGDGPQGQWHDALLLWSEVGGTGPQLVTALHELAAKRQVTIARLDEALEPNGPSRGRETYVRVQNGRRPGGAEHLPRRLLWATAGVGGDTYITTFVDGDHLTTAALGWAAPTAVAEVPAWLRDVAARLVPEAVREALSHARTGAVTPVMWFRAGAGRDHAEVRLDVVLDPSVRDATVGVTGERALQLAVASRRPELPELRHAAAGFTALFRDALDANCVWDR